MIGRHCLTAPPSPIAPRSHHRTTTRPTSYRVPSVRSTPSPSLSSCRGSARRSDRCRGVPRSKRTRPIGARSPGDCPRSTPSAYRPWFRGYIPIRTLTDSRTGPGSSIRVPRRLPSPSGPSFRDHSRPPSRPYPRFNRSLRRSLLRSLAFGSLSVSRSTPGVLTGRGIVVRASLGAIRQARPW